MLAINGILTYNPFSRNILYFGVGIEIWIFSLALANRLSDIRKEKEETTLALYAKIRENEKLILNQNEILENKVKEKTKDLTEKTDLLKIANEELHSLNEELEAVNEDLVQKNKFIYENNEKLMETMEELKSTQDQLVQAEKMASLGILTSGVAHEINNPLNFIKSGATYIDSFIKDSHPNTYNELEPVFNGVFTGVDRVSDIVKSLNNYAAFRKDKVEPSNLIPIIESALQMLSYQIHSDICIIKEFPEKEIPVLINSGKIHQVFLNLLSNAIQAIQNKGFIKITLSYEDQMAKIKFEDNGSGISQEDIGKIFDPFFTTKDPGKGVGLGLYLSYKILEEHQANISVVSNPLVSTCFTINIPTI